MDIVGQKLLKIWKYQRHHKKLIFLREKYSHIRWLASKLAAKTFGDKIQQDVKQDTTITVSWGNPNDMVEAKKIVEEVQTTSVPSLSNG